MYKYVSITLVMFLLNMAFSIEPLKDSLYLELKKKNINKMTDREYDYFKEMKKLELKAENSSKDSLETNKKNSNNFKEPESQEENRDSLVQLKKKSPRKGSSASRPETSKKEISLEEKSDVNITYERKSDALTQLEKDKFEHQKKTDNIILIATGAILIGVAVLYIWIMVDMASDEPEDIY
ncbi:MAG: hypothetical protein HQK83_10330 [Fibrobacteria bacterium]|nr:hypothetical protein [Fibrobacteria bacterium]